MNKNKFFIILLVVLSFAILLPIKSFAYQKEKIVKVKVTNLNFRTSPWGKVLGQLSYGKNYKVYGYKKDTKGVVWYKIYSNGRYGYVYSSGGYTSIVSKASSSNQIKRKSVKAVKKLKKAKDTIILIKTGYLNFRTSPWGRKIGVVKKGSKYKVYGYKKDTKGVVWYKIYSNGRYGYVYSSGGYTSIVSKATSLKPIKRKSTKTVKKSKKAKDTIILIKTDYLNFRTSPWGRKIGVVKKGSKYKVYGYKKDSKGNVWYKIKRGSNYGYIYAGNGYTKLVSKPEIVRKNVKHKTVNKKVGNNKNKVMLVLIRDLNFRALPWGKRLGFLTYNKEYRIYGRKKDSKGNIWYKIKHGSNYGYAYAGNGYTKLVTPSINLNIKVPVVIQTPELPNGCEAVALTSALRYWGCNLGKAEIADKYLAKRPFYRKKGKLYGPDPQIAFAGNPRSRSGWFVYEKPVVKAAKLYLKNKKIKLNVEAMYNPTENKLVSELKSGNPLVVWVTRDMSPARFNYSWYSETSGRKIIAPVNLHSVVLYGLSGNTFKVMNPYLGYRKYNRYDFMKAFRSLGSRAIKISK
ncbi:MAG: hypothetical protein CSB15_01380 [Clostridiales bacterium]|nr:MAG: hypothetical protein CSB15_01380 [Clostridiales bacterium]